jgi:hypothetical protein
METRKWLRCNRVRTGRKGSQCARLMFGGRRWMLQWLYVHTYKMYIQIVYICIIFIDMYVHWVLISIRFLRSRITPKTGTTDPHSKNIILIRTSENDFYFLFRKPVQFHRNDYFIEIPRRRCKNIVYNIASRPPAGYTRPVLVCSW